MGSQAVEMGPGSVFAGEFRIVRLLAEGGMGTVYVAEQISTGKERALKLLQRQLVGDAKQRERFEQEARASARIESDHVVEVVGARVEESSGTPWLAMELLKGRTLADTMKERGALPHDEAREVLEQLGDAIGAAHRAGIVHRDLKPENIFVAAPRRRGVRCTVKVLDFGIAKLLQENRATASATAPIGSTFWMAPEQSESDGAIRPATDVWALGLIAFHVYTGKIFWRAANAARFSPTALMREVLMSSEPRASDRS